MDIDIDCQIAAQEGIWNLYQEYATDRAKMARLILEVVDDEPDRFAYFDVKLIGRVKEHAKRR